MGLTHVTPGIFSNAASNNIYLNGGTIVGGTSFGINLQGGTVYASESTITSASAAIGPGAANSKYVDLCGNTLVGTVTATNLVFVPCLTATYTQAVPFAAITGTGACATSSTLHGNIFNGSAVCTAATAASTFIITPGITAQNGWNCQGTFDQTTYAVPTAITTTTTACTVTFASVTTNDVISFKAQQF